MQSAKQDELRSDKHCSTHTKSRMLSLFVKCEKYISDKERRPVNSLGTAWICPTNFCIEYEPITYVYYIYLMIASKSFF